jgi:3-oxoacyl-[acyl-carrier protein] reductase
MVNLVPVLGGYSLAADKRAIGARRVAGSGTFVSVRQDNGAALPLLAGGAFVANECWMARRTRSSEAKVDMKLAACSVYGAVARLGPVSAQMLGKVVLITGGARAGLGKAIAKLLAGQGAAVIVTSRKTRKPAPPASAELFGEVTERALNVSDERSVKRLFAWLDSRFERIDVLVNNAGVGIFKPVTEISLADWREVIATNLDGVFLCSREAFKRMKARGGGRIINIGSVADYIPLANNAAYGASKSGVRGLSGILNEEGKEHAIRVTHLSLGATYTEIWKDRKGFAEKDMLTPNDVAETVLDLARKPLHVRVDELKLLPSKGII